MRVQGPGFRVESSGFRVQGPGFRVQVGELRVEGPGFTLARLTTLRECRPMPLFNDAATYRGTLLIRNSPPPKDHHRALGSPTVGS